MTDYVMRFDVARVDPDTESRLLQDGRFTVSTRAGKWTVEAEDSGTSAIDVAQRLITSLVILGLRVDEALPELVTMADIARRAGVSKQAVSNWANRDVSEDAFPRPWNSTDTTLIWDWCPVNDWLRSRGHGHDAWSTLTIEQTRHVNDWLSAHRIPRRPADTILRARPLNQVPAPQPSRGMHVQPA